MRLGVTSSCITSVVQGPAAFDHGGGCLDLAISVQPETFKLPTETLSPVESGQ